MKNSKTNKWNVVPNDKKIVVSGLEKDPDGGYMWDRTIVDGSISESDAHLISAAPEMLEALEALLDDRGMMGSSTWDRAAAVLKKARGE